MNKKNNKIPVLVLSGHTIALGVVRALGSKGIPVYLVSYDKSKHGPKIQIFKISFVLSHPEKKAEEFIVGLLKIGDQIGRAVIFAADDPTLVTLSQNLETLKSNFIIPTPDWSIIKKVINKDITYTLAEQVGVPIQDSFT